MEVIATRPLQRLSANNGSSTARRTVPKHRFARDIEVSLGRRVPIFHALTSSQHSNRFDWQGR